MPKLCEYQTCRNRASYSYFYGKSDRCKTHREDRKPQYEICTCGSSSPTFNYKGEIRASYCKKCRTENMVNFKNSTCQEDDCNIIPKFNYIGEKKGLYCSTHKKQGMINIMSKRCVQDGCTIICPRFNFFGEKSGVYCKLHKKQGMINVIDKRCQEKECKLLPGFNYPGEKIGIYCNLHKKQKMINVVCKRCQENGCGKASRFNYIGKKIGIYCNQHKKDEMINVKDKKCLEDGCMITPKFNYIGKKIGIYCSLHKKEEMINVKERRKCQTDGCNLIPKFNYPGEKIGIYCSQHKKQDMINVVNKRCLEKDCMIAPKFNNLGKKIGMYCTKHKKQGMINVVEKRCPNCIDWIDSQKGNKKYKNYCTRCFQYLFPNDPLTFQIRCKTKEIAVRDFINANFKDFQHDKPLYTDHCDCTHRRRIDHRKLINNTLLCIETDEHQHKRYDKKDEEDRYNDIYIGGHSGKLIFIRFNPDSYTSSKGIKKNPTIGTRLLQLKEEIMRQINRIEEGDNEDLLEIIKLYYDGYD